jgi:glutaredoxin
MWIIYGQPTCSFCKAARTFLLNKGEEVKYIDMVTPDNIADFQSLFPGARTVPQIITPEGRKIGGYDNLLALFEAS